MTGFTMKMEEKIRQKLLEKASPTHLVVENQSHLHAGHAGDDGSGESHFHVEIWSDTFEQMSRVERERFIYKVLSDEMRFIHALGVTIKRPIS